MSDVKLLANHAVAMLAQALPFLAQRVGDGFADQPGARLYNWLLERLRGQPAEALLERAVADPGSPRTLDALRLELADLLEKDRKLNAELVAFFSADQAAQAATVAR